MDETPLMWEWGCGPGYSYDMDYREPEPNFEVTIRLTPLEMQQQDRGEFRRVLHEKMQKAGDEIMKAWEGRSG